MKIQNRQKQSGFLFPIVFILLAVISALLYNTRMVLLHKEHVRVKELVIKKVERMLQAAYSYHVDNAANEPDPLSVNRWPLDMTVLYTSNYLSECPITVDTCIPIDKTPWDSDIIFLPYTPQDLTDPANPIDLPARLQFTIDTANYGRNNASDIGLANELAGHFPGATVTGTIVEFEFDRPGSEIAHDALVRTDGTTPLEANWLIGGFNIEDVGDIKFKDYIGGDGEPVSLRDSTFDVVGLFSHDERFAKPSCPVGSESKIYTAISYIRGKGSKAVKFGAIDTFAINSGNDYIVQIRYFTEDTSGNPIWEYPNAIDAKALVLSRCLTL
ncbi:hypothetical protein [Aliivibrio fischeri]|uniref:hypothetical protein n=1 Tax=Aliivibrio fischeri TaxID=668 RepID=UPI0007C5A95E|nr:hypothetical protein [Aliivibrio fischeri]